MSSGTVGSLTNPDPNDRLFREYTGKGESIGTSGTPSLMASPRSIKFTAAPESTSALCWEEGEKIKEKNQDKHVTNRGFWVSLVLTHLG